MSDSKVSELPELEVFIRKSDLDDVEPLNRLITQDILNDLNRLYNFPTILNLFQKSYISFTILNADQEIIGAGCFDDFPQGLKGKYDNVHQNLWEEWIDKAYNVQGLTINSYNSLWMTFLFVNPKYNDAIETISEKLLQSLYVLQPQLEGVLYLKRGQVEILEQIQDVYRMIKGHFLQFKLRNPEILKNLIGISYKSKVFYSPKSHVNQSMQIRMARQEDHDDLAYIFNKQSEVLTSQFGEFFIADLIAAQNLTRRMNRGDRSQGKAIVGQVQDKAIGLMSISTQIDYGLLNQHFELDTYEHLVKSDLLQAINNRYQQIEHLQKVNKFMQDKRIKKLLHQQRIKSFKIGQRILLQNYCIERQAIFKNQFNNILKQQPKNQNLTDEGFQKILQTCLSDFQLYIPSDIFQKYPEYAKDLQTYVMSSSQFFIETLELFGLPKNYVKREGHWKDWVKSILQKRMDDQLRRPKNKKAPNTKKKGKDKKEEDNDLKPPSHFDLSPLNEAYLKFISVGAQIRTIFRQQLAEKMKRVVMLFCDQKGRMVSQRVIDMNTLGKVMNQNGIAVSPQVSQNLSSLLEAFGAIGYDEKVVQMQEKAEQKKSLLKKDAGPKIVDVTQKLVSYHQFAGALENIKVFDIQLARLGYLKNSPSLDSELKRLKQQQQATNQKQQAAHAREFDFGQYRQLVKNLKQGQLPEIPYEANNAIVINLFCIDEIFEARSLQFVEYAFTLFPDRDYIIITQPFTVPESTLVKSFIQVPHKKNSNFEHCLYIFHKDYLFSKQIKVRRSKLEDIDRAQYLIQEMLNPAQIESTIKNSITETSSMYYTMTVTCGHDLIGMYTISKNVNLDYYVSHFFVQDHVIINQHPRQSHGKVIYSLINPLFIKSVRYILKEIMRLTNKTCLYFEVHNRTLLPDIFNEFTPLRMRIFPHLLKRKWNFQYEKQDLQRRLKNKGGVDMDRNPYDEQQAPFSLSMIAKKNLNYIKQSNNTRIVVVGASDTGISFIQSLLTIKNITFTNIMLLSPGGIVTMHVKNQNDFLKACSTNYTLDEIKNLMLDARTTVVDSKMVKLDKKNKKILIDRNAYIPFDLLILSVGLIDTLLQSQGLISYGLAHFPFYKDKQHIKGVYSIDDPYLYQHFSIESENIKLLKRKKKPQSITIYGRTPHTIAFISGIVARGVDPKRIYYVVPGSTRRRSTYFESNQQRIEYDSALINDPDTFEDINVEKQVINQLRSIGVNVELGFQFNGIDGNPCTGIKFRKKAQNYDEIDEQIKRKQAEIAQKAQQVNKIQQQIQEDSQDVEQKISPQKQIQMLRQRQWKQLYTPSSFFITSGLVDIDKQIFNIIHENGLVYNGRLIVKSNFQTTQNQIFACGKICEFSQRYKNFAIGKSLRLDRYNGRQLGRILSQHVLEILNLSYLTTEKYTEDELPKLYIPTGIGSSLFNGMVYYYIKRTQNALPKVVIQKNARNQQIVSKNIKDFKGHYIKFSIDPNNIIESVSYMGSEGVVVPSLMSFVGMSVTYLNKIMKRNDHGMITDIVEFLSQNWAICLYHELFSEFRHYIKKSLASSPIAERINNRASEKASDGDYFNNQFMQQIKALIPPQIINQIRAGTISFIQQNRNHLPMYYIPSGAQK